MSPTRGSSIFCATIWTRRSLPLAGHSVPFTPPTEARWGRVTQLTMPSGGKLGLYQPYHPLALDARTQPRRPHTDR